MDASGYVLIIGAVFLGGTQVLSMLIAYWREEAKIRRDELAAAKVEEVRTQAMGAAKKVEEVKRTLVETSSIADNKLDKIHILVNSAMGAQLETVAIALRRLAEYSPSQENLEAAKLADEKLASHRDKQKTVDVKTT